MRSAVRWGCSCRWRPRARCLWEVLPDRRHGQLGSTAPGGAFSGGAWGLRAPTCRLSPPGASSGDGVLLSSWPCLLGLTRAQSVPPDRWQRPCRTQALHRLVLSLGAQPSPDEESPAHCWPGPLFSEGPGFVLYRREQNTSSFSRPAPAHGDPSTPKSSSRETPGFARNCLLQTAPADRARAPALERGSLRASKAQATVLEGMWPTPWRCHTCPASAEPHLPSPLQKLSRLCCEGLRPPGPSPIEIRPRRAAGVPQLASGLQATRVGSRGSRGGRLESLCLFQEWSPPLPWASCAWPLSPWVGGFAQAAWASMSRIQLQLPRVPLA